MVRKQKPDDDAVCSVVYHKTEDERNHVMIEIMKFMIQTKLKRKSNETSTIVEENLKFSCKIRFIVVS